MTKGNNGLDKRVEETDDNRTMFVIYSYSSPSDGGGDNNDHFSSEQSQEMSVMPYILYT